MKQERMLNTLLIVFLWVATLEGEPLKNLIFLVDENQEALTKHDLVVLQRQSNLSDEYDRYERAQRTRLRSNDPLTQILALALAQQASPILASRHLFHTLMFAKSRFEKRISTRNGYARHFEKEGIEKLKKLLTYYHDDVRRQDDARCEDDAHHGMVAEEGYLGSVSSVVVKKREVLAEEVDEKKYDPEVPRSPVTQEKVLEKLSGHYDYFLGFPLQQDAIFYHMLSSALNEWIILAIKDQPFYLFIPQRLIKEIDSVREGTQTSLKQKLPLLGFNTEEISGRVSLDSISEDTYEGKPRPDKNFSANAVTMIDKLLKAYDSASGWVLYLLGHGLANIDIGGIGVPEFKRFVSTLNEKGVRVMHVSSCYAGGEKNLRHVQVALEATEAQCRDRECEQIGFVMSASALFSIQGSVPGLWMHSKETAQPHFDKFVEEASTLPAVFPFHSPIRFDRFFTAFQQLYDQHKKPDDRYPLEGVVHNKTIQKRRQMFEEMLKSITHYDFYEKGFELSLMPNIRFPGREQKFYPVKFENMLRTLSFVETKRHEHNPDRPPFIIPAVKGLVVCTQSVGIPLIFTGDKMPLFIPRAPQASAYFLAQVKADLITLKDFITQMFYGLKEYNYDQEMKILIDEVCLKDGTYQDFFVRFFQGKFNVIYINKDEGYCYRSKPGKMTEFGRVEIDEEVDKIYEEINPIKEEIGKREFVLDRSAQFTQKRQREKRKATLQRLKEQEVAL